MEVARRGKMNCNIKILNGEPGFAVRWFENKILVKIFIKNNYRPTLSQLYQASRVLNGLIKPPKYAWKVAKMPTNKGEIEAYIYNILHGMNFQSTHPQYRSLRQDEQSQMYGAYKHIRAPEPAPQYTSAYVEHAQSAQLHQQKQSGVQKAVSEADIEAIREHMKIYGAHPCMTNRTPRGRKKITNYIRSVIGDPGITEHEALSMADQV